MTIQQAIHIAGEEAVRCERLAKDLSESPLDSDGKALDHAKRYHEKAEAMKILIRVAKAFDRAGRE